MVAVFWRDARDWQNTLERWYSKTYLSASWIWWGSFMGKKKNYGNRPCEKEYD